MKLFGILLIAILAMGCTPKEEIKEEKKIEKKEEVVIKKEEVKKEEKKEVEVKKMLTSKEITQKLSEFVKAIDEAKRISDQNPKSSLYHYEVGIRYFEMLKFMKEYNRILDKSDWQKQVNDAKNALYRSIESKSEKDDRSIESQKILNQFNEFE